MLTAGMSTRAVARELDVHFSTMILIIFLDYYFFLNGREVICL